jgi:hypothetical protein
LRSILCWFAEHLEIHAFEIPYPVDGERMRPDVPSRSSVPTTLQRTRSSLPVQYEPELATVELVSTGQAVKLDDQLSL